MKRYINYLIRIYKTYILRDKFLLAYKEWVRDKGDETLRLEYDLTPDSIVFDIGGFQGEFSKKIFDKYRAKVYIFEPVESFFDVIQSKFKENNKIQCFNFGLSNHDKEIEINLDNDGSSIYVDSEEKETIQLKSITRFIAENNISKINLCKINIEGGEFEILPALTNSLYIKNIENIQVQFHNFVENAEAMRDEIRKQLSITHELTYNYYFIWENWKLKK